LFLRGKNTIFFQLASSLQNLFYFCRAKITRKMPLTRFLFFLMTAAVIVSMAALVSCKKDKTPVISIAAHPSNANVAMGSITERLTVQASVTEGATLTYQWYSNTTASNANGTAIGGATTANYDIPTSRALGKYYYFCEVRATGAASVRSNVATVTVNDPAVFDKGVVISGVTWATRNVGEPKKFASKPEAAGMFYQWNRNIGWSSTDPMVNSNEGLVWDASIPTGDTWKPANDPCPYGWRVPTQTELESLRSSVVSGELEEINGVKGRYFGSGTEKIFLPAAGFRHSGDGALGNVGRNGFYWSGTAYDIECAYNLYFDSVDARWYPSIRSFGSSVRCVSAE
jgi:uncharacterized protein (TIGR02145 family)